MDMRLDNRLLNTANVYTALFLPGLMLLWHGLFGCGLDKTLLVGLSAAAVQCLGLGLWLATLAGAAALFYRLTRYVRGRAFWGLNLAGLAAGYLLADWLHSSMLVWGQAALLVWAVLLLVQLVMRIVFAE